MHREHRNREFGGHCLDHPASLTGGADADRVTERYLVAAEVGETSGNIHDGRGCNPSLIGTPEHAGHVAAYRDRALCGKRDDRPEPLDAFTDRAVDVALGEGFGRRGEDSDFVNLRLDGLARTLLVGHEHAVGDTTDLGQRTHQIPGSCHLGNAAWRDEAADFYPAQSRVCELCNECGPYLDWNGNRLVLQAVARPYLHDRDKVSHHPTRSVPPPRLP